MITQDDIDRLGQAKAESRPELHFPSDKSTVFEDGYEAGFRQAAELMRQFHADNSASESPFYSGNSAAILVAYFAKIQL